MQEQSEDRVKLDARKVLINQLVDSMMQKDKFGDRNMAVKLALGMLNNKSWVVIEQYYGIQSVSDVVKSDDTRYEHINTI
jgi:hypothetical protein